jgi:hypothetical protein
MSSAPPKPARRLRYSRGVNRLALVAIAVFGVSCKKDSASTSPAATKWLDLPPMPIKMQVPVNATLARHSESPDRDAPPGVIVSARECVLVVLPGSRGDMAAQEAEIVQATPTAKVDRREPPGATGTGLFLGYHYASGDKTVKSFRYEVTLGEATYHCAPFSGRPDVTCEERACRSLAAR